MGEECSNLPLRIIHTPCSPKVRAQSKRVEKSLPSIEPFSGAVPLCLIDDPIEERLRRDISYDNSIVDGDSARASLAPRAAVGSACAAVPGLAAAVVARAAALALAEDPTGYVAGDSKGYGEG